MTACICQNLTSHNIVLISYQLYIKKSVKIVIDWIKEWTHNLGQLFPRNLPQMYILCFTFHNWITRPLNFQSLRILGMDFRNIIDPSILTFYMEDSTSTTPPQTLVKKKKLVWKIWPRLGRSEDSWYFMGKNELAEIVGSRQENHSSNLHHLLRKDIVDHGLKNPWGEEELSFKLWEGNERINVTMKKMCNSPIL